MTTAITSPRTWTLWNDIQVRTIRVTADGESIWQLSDVHESHDPMDRVGGPFRICNFVDEDEDGNWFMVVVADCAFPPVILVRVNGHEPDALDAFAEWCADGVTDDCPGGRYGLVVQDFESADYDEDSANVIYTSRGMVDIDNAQLIKVRFHSAEA